jgi:hypothetical protein
VYLPCMTSYDIRAKVSCKDSLALTMLLRTIINTHSLLQDRFCGLVVRVPGHRTDMYCLSCEVRTEFIYVRVR